MAGDLQFRWLADFELQCAFRPAQNADLVTLIHPGIGQSMNNKIVLAIMSNKFHHFYLSLWIIIYKP